MPRKTTTKFCLALSLFLGGCGGGQTDSTGSGGGPPLAPADTKDFTHAFGLVTAKVTIDGQEGRLVFDSGSPVNLISAITYSNQQPGIDKASKIVVNDKSTFTDVQVASGNGFASGDPKVETDGIAGCDLFCGSRVAFDYREATVSLGASPAPTGVGKVVKVPFTLEGGGTRGGIVIPKSRVVVDVMIDGAKHPMIIDTGASAITVRPELFDSIVSDGRPTAPGPELETVEGLSKSKIARIGSFSIGDVTAKGVVALGDAQFGTLLDEVAKDVGHDIDGSVGASFLGRYHLVIDYPSSTLELAPYDAPDVVADIGRSIGFAALLEKDGSFQVTQVAAGSDAAKKGIAVGDKIAALDGAEVGSLTAGQMHLAITGPIGTTRHVKFGKARSASVSGQTIDLAVFDLLAPPQK